MDNKLGLDCSPNEVTAGDSLPQSLALFPSVRYFQIHFEFLHEQLRLTHLTLDTLQRQVQALEQQLLNETQQSVQANDDQTPTIYPPRSTQASKRPPKRRRPI